MLSTNDALGLCEGGKMKSYVVKRKDSARLPACGCAGASHCLLLTAQLLLSCGGAAALVGCLTARV